MHIRFSCSQATHSYTFWEDLGASTSCTHPVATSPNHYHGYHIYIVRTCNIHKGVDSHRHRDAGEAHRHYAMELRSGDGTECEHASCCCSGRSSECSCLHTDEQLLQEVAAKQGYCDIRLHALTKFDSWSLRCANPNAGLNTSRSQPITGQRSGEQAQPHHDSLSTLGPKPQE